MARSDSYVGLHVFCSLLTAAAVGVLWYADTPGEAAVIAVAVPVGLGVGVLLAMTRVRRFRGLLMSGGWAVSAGLVAGLVEHPAGEPLAAVLLYPAALLWPGRWVSLPSERIGADK